jgi:hypothetical protein
MTVEVRTAAAAMVSDEVYRAKLMKDLRQRRVSPPVETMLWAYAFGRPVERHEVTTSIGDFSKLSDEELIARFEETARSLRC